MVFHIYMPGGAVHKTTPGAYESTADVETAIEKGEELHCSRKPTFNESRLRSAAKALLDETHPNGIQGPQIDTTIEDLFDAVAGTPEANIDYFLLVKKYVGIGKFQ